MSDLVFKILPASATFHSVNYNTKKEKNNVAKMVHFQNFGALGIGGVLPNEKEVIKYLEHYSSTNSRTKNKQFHAVMSCKGYQFSHEELKNKAMLMMEELGYKEQPMLIYGHSDTANNHVHIVSTRIDRNGNKINDSFGKKRSAEILKKMLSRNTNKELQTDLHKCFSYKFSTEAQFRLLMENLGYKITIENEKMKFIKYASIQGEISKEGIYTRLQKENDSNRIYQIRAIIKKYQLQFDTVNSCTC